MTVVMGFFFLDISRTRNKKQYTMIAVYTLYKDCHNLRKLQAETNNATRGGNPTNTPQ